ncbi:MAG TPA: hypothetical protein PK777_13095, partial [Thermoguttaceae bacterium]|nr:hypothetical protein [Thermoguttaceae bacterium]
MKSFSRMAHRTKQRRRGVLLLVILGLLAMFSLIALTFVIVASQAKRSAIAAGRAEVFVSPEDRVAARIGWRVTPPVSGDVVDPYVQFVHEAFLRVLRGVDTTAEPNNPIAFHSLLEDIYGPDSVRATISGASLACGNALIEVSLSGVSEPWWLVGRVLTVLDGPARGLSTHIVGYNPTSGQLQLRSFGDLPPSVSLTDLPTALQNKS